MAVRTVTVDLRLDAGSYLAIARSVVRANQGIDRSLNDIAASAATSGAAMTQMGRDMAQMAARARLAERRIRDLREEIDRLIAAQAAAAAGAPIPNFGTGRGGGGGMRGMLMSPEVLAAGGIVVAAAGPAIAATISGLILTAVGAISLAPPIISALKDDDVQHAFVEFGDFVSSEFKKYGNAFQVPLIDAAEHFSDRFASISPKVLGVLSEMSVAVRPLSEGLTGFIEKAGPGIAGAMRGSIPVLKAISDELPRMGHYVGEFFDMIGEGSEGAADAMYTMMRVVELTSSAVGTQILYLTTLFEKANDYGALFGASGALLGLDRGDTTSSITSLKSGYDDLGETFEGVTYKADSARYALAKLSAQIAGDANELLDARAKYREFEEAIDGLKESIDDNGRSMDVTTAKGRANTEALDEAIRKAYETRAANLAMGDSLEVANAKFNAMIEQVRQAAYAAGYNKQQVDALIASLKAIPTNVTTTITTKYKTIFLTEGQSPGGRGAPGTRYAYRDGGIWAARDGLDTGAIFTGGRPIVKFAEAGTGREAFIAQNAPASRSLAIANTAAGWHGGQVVPKGWTGGTSPAGVHITVAATPTGAGNPMVDMVLGMFRNGQLRMKVDRANRVVPA